MKRIARRLVRLASVAALGCATLAHAAVSSLAPSGDALQLAAPGLAVPVPVRAKALDAGNAPVAGVAVTFTAPATGPSVVFTNGTNAITVTTDASGMARATAVAGEVAGLVPVQASAAGVATITTSRYVVTGPIAIATDWTTSYPFGEVTSLDAQVRIPWFPCSEASAAPALFAGGNATLTANGIAIPTTAITTAPCTGSGYAISLVSDLSALLPGTYDLDLLYGAPHALGLVEARGRIAVRAGLDIPGADGAASFGLSFARTVAGAFAGRCTEVAARAGNAGDEGFPAAGPPDVERVGAFIKVDATHCDWGIAVSSPPPIPPAERTLRQDVLLQTGAAPLPEGTTIWAYGPSSDNADPHWYEVPTALSGANAMFRMVDGAAADNSIGEDGQLHGILAVGTPHVAAIAGTFQDLWWAGPAENGWGMSLTQHDDRLFAGLFIYDMHGDPTWLVMSGGSWNAERTRYTGSLYRPHGSVYTAYDAKQFSVGPPVGSLTLTFTSLDTLTLEYTVDGVTGSKPLQRQRFGPADPYYAPSVSDLWWGGVKQNGWGVAIAQQYSTAFGVFFTYDTNGDPVWFVMPDLRASAGVYTSRLYRTHGSAWVGASYDASRLDVTEVGTGSLDSAYGEETFSFTIDGQSLSQPVYRQGF